MRAGWRRIARSTWQPRSQPREQSSTSAPHESLFRWGAPCRAEPTFVSTRQLDRVRIDRAAVKRNRLLASGLSLGQRVRASGLNCLLLLCFVLLTGDGVPHNRRKADDSY